MEDFVSLSAYADDWTPQQPTQPEASTSKKRKRPDQDQGSETWPWCAQVDWDNHSSASSQLTAEVEAFYEWIKPNEAEHAVRSGIVSSIRKAITARWPDAAVEPFGSYKTQLYLPSG